MTPRQRVLAALEFRSPDRAPRDLWALPWVSMYAGDDHQQVLAKYPSDFTAAGALARGDRASGNEARKGTYVDDWGCAFAVAEDGVIGEVKGPPLADWSALASYRPP